MLLPSFRPMKGEQGIQSRVNDRFVTRRLRSAYFAQTNIGFPKIFLPIPLEVLSSL